ncbi:MAG: G5 domain-containing protein [Anaerolineales bacterium]|jgi:hypothetical protein
MASAVRLYQSSDKLKKDLYHILGMFLSFIILVFFISACDFPQRRQDDISVKISADGISKEVNIPTGTTAREALEMGGININPDDRSDPPFFTTLSDGGTVHLTRVVEDFVIEESILPFETQVLRNESLPEGETRLIQPGVNGVQETTFRIILEDSVEVSRSPVNTVIVHAPIPEVVMVGNQAPFASVPIAGKLAYISAGNAWVMETNTGVRRPVVTTGDLDSRIFSISPDGNWLLYTRSDESDQVINTLWVSRIDEEETLEIDLNVTNVIHFADWVTDSVNGVVFSTAETIQSPPGWQANNDLKFLNFSSSGWVSRPRTSIRESSGGVYGWWGVDYFWSNDGEQLAYTRPDEIGLVDLETELLVPLYNFPPLQTRSDWAWMPEISWSPDGMFLFFVDHTPQEGLSSDEESPLFSLGAIPLFGVVPVLMIQEVGMFANPLASPVKQLPNNENSYQVAYLQALMPTQSRTGGYQLVVIDRDGSNSRVLFPPEGNPGLEPHRYFWSPEIEEGEGSETIAVIYQGNIWLIDIAQGTSQQLTGDGLITAIDWK